MDYLLIVEDDRELNHGMRRALDMGGLKAYSCHTIDEARVQMRTGKMSLALLDVNLPDGSGLDLLREIKACAPEVPVILITANDMDIDVVDGLERGADDYITKPFSLSVLRARINTQLRRAAVPQSEQIFCMDHFSFDFAGMRFLTGQKSVELSRTEQKLLRLLVENQGITMSRSELVDRIWVDSAECVEENALSVTVNRLRNKLGAQKYIKTVYGIGYKWEK